MTEVFANRKYTYAVGRRKTAIASVRLYDKGEGIIMINEKPVKEYCHLDVVTQGIIEEVFQKLGLPKAFDVSIQVKGGGKHSQAESIRHGIARAISLLEKDKRIVMKKLGFLTRDSRRKERKKPGLKGARRAPQWSKR